MDDAALRLQRFVSQLSSITGTTKAQTEDERRYIEVIPRGLHIAEAPENGCFRGHASRSCLARWKPRKDDAQHKVSGPGSASMRHIFQVAEELLMGVAMNDRYLCNHHGNIRQVRVFSLPSAFSQGFGAQFSLSMDLACFQVYSNGLDLYLLLALGSDFSNLFVDCPSQIDLDGMFLRRILLIYGTNIRQRESWQQAIRVYRKTGLTPCLGLDRLHWSSMGAPMPPWPFANSAIPPGQIPPLRPPPPQGGAFHTSYAVSRASIAATTAPTSMPPPSLEQFRLQTPLPNMPQSPQVFVRLVQKTLGKPDSVLQDNDLPVPLIEKISYPFTEFLQKKVIPRQRKLKSENQNPSVTSGIKLNYMFFEKMNPELKQVWVPGPVIVGAGPSGLATAACLKEKGVPSLILERDKCVASLWKLKTYDRLRLHLPKKFCELPYMEFPPEFPVYPTKQQFISYLEAYSKHFSIEPMFEEEVRWTGYDSTMGIWRVRTNETEFLCRWLIVATGENAQPTFPEIAGISGFRGRFLHTSAYENGADFRGEKVLVVGCGNSGMEISLDLCNNGAQASIVLHILPREMFGRSTFGISMRLLKWFPLQLVDLFLLLSSRLILGDIQRFGIRRPEIGPLELKNSTGKTPVLDVGTLAKIKTGQIKTRVTAWERSVNDSGAGEGEDADSRVVPGIQRFTTKAAEFVDGRVEEFDSVILATGYRSNVPSWLKEGEFFCEQNGYPRTPFPNSWKGKNGLYSVGFTKRGLLGTSMDAQSVAEDIAQQWNSATKHLRYEL
ncbi:hypothetical protein HHK36_002454 [Tetracentron sinense]|uniref:indole-3-pyruvate monooxygenase n=1 Tax=Tetracentron sinense TaxID=13715 RepID=A0A834ZQC1_TETSI|nr:hypothetical protein HHK36_002454 [Tetracentron sinense]